MTTTTHQQGEISPEHQAIIDAQVRDWRKEIDRLQDLIAHATGGQQGESVDLDSVRNLPMPGPQYHDEYRRGYAEALIDVAAQARASQPKREMPPEMKAAIEEAHKTGATSALLPNGSAVFINYGHDFGDNDHLNCTACGGSGHIEDQQARASQPSAASDAQPVGADERALFEHAERASDLTRSEGHEDDYANPCVQSAWEGWQARAALSTPAATADLSDAEFLSKRLARVAKAAGVSMPTDMTHEQIAEVAGTILGDIARKLEGASGQAGATVAAGWRPMETAPKDGTMVRLLVNFSDNATEDTSEPCPTIGANNFDHDGIDEWKFAGWDWQHDCFTEGAGSPVHWMPMFAAPASPATGMASSVEALAARLESMGVTDIGTTPGPNPTPEKVAAEIMRALDEIEGAAPATQAADTDARDWARAEQISNVPAVDDALRDFSDDPTAESGICVVLAVLAAMSASVSEADGSGKGALDVGDQS